MAEEKRYFWLKLNENFFEQEEIKIIEGMENGEKYVNFYLKLLLKSLSADGKLLFRNVIPYTPEMLATITNTNIDTVRIATKLFVSLGLMEKLDDGSLFMSEVENMVGSETGWAKKKRIQRGKKDNVPKLSEKCPTEIELEIELDKDIDNKENIEKRSDTPTHRSKNFTPPTVEEIKSYCTERKNSVDPERFYDFYTSKGWVVGKTKMKDWKASVRTWERSDNRARTSTGNERNNGTHTGKRKEEVPKYGEVF